MVRVGLGLNELYVDPHPVSRPLHAAFEYAANVELPSDLLKVGGFAFVGKGGAATDDEGTGNAREVSGQAFGDFIDEIVLLRIAADVGKRQNDDGKARG